MRYGISAGTILVEDSKILLVRHKGAGMDFWVPPGGSVEGEESVFECARREAFEETGLDVELDRIIYIEEFVDGDLRFCKLYILATAAAGVVTLENKTEEEDFLIDVRYFSQSDLSGMTVFPDVIKGQFWMDLENGFPETRYLGLTRVEKNPARDPS